MKTKWTLLCTYFCLLQFKRADAENTIKVELFSPEEILKLEEFRELAEKIVERDDMKTDPYLIRYLQAKNMNVGAALGSLKDTIKWRKDNNIDNILNEEFPQEFLRCPFLIIGSKLAKDGRPIIYLFPKYGDTKKWVLGGQAAQFVRIWLHHFERIEDEIMKSGNSTNQHVRHGLAIADFQSYNRRQHACIRCFQAYTEFLRVLDRYYPRLFNTGIVINAPRIFGPLFELIKTVISPALYNIISVYGVDKNEWRPKLLEVISEDQFPSRIIDTNIRE